MAKRKDFILILILGLLSAIGPFSIDMYLPGFPAIAADLGTPVDRVALSLSSFFIGISAGQLICGPLLDRFGRKRPLYIGLLLYILSSVGCALAGTVEALIFWRLLQALGGCVGMVAPRAMVRDLFPVQENAKVFSLLILVIGVSPIVAPTAGSFLIDRLGWHSVFVVLAAITTLILASVVFALPESKKPDPHFSLRPGPILNAFLLVLRHPQFYTYALTGALSGAGLFAYIAGSPSVFMELYGVTEQQYGWIFALVALGLITSSQLNRALLKRRTSEQVIHATLLVQTATGSALLAGTALGWLGLYGTIGLIFIFLSCQGFSFPNASALSMAPFSRHAGSASALMGALQMGLGALSSAAVSVLSNGTALPMTGVMAACSIVALCLLWAGRRKIVQAAREEDVEEQAFELLEKY